MWSRYVGNVGHGTVDRLSRGDVMGGTADGGQTVGQDASMMDTARDELAAYMAEAETMSQSFEEDERVWQAQHSAAGAPNAESRGAESEQPPLVDRLHEASATSVTLLAQAEQARPASPTGQDAGSGEPGE